ncbi:MAG: TIM barrel protein [Nitrospiraceae bacterium]|nr:TIM barrel protein [Nitrospiraceae bacterium]
MTQRVMGRRGFCGCLLGGAVALGVPGAAHGAPDFSLRYALASSMYGTMALGTIVPEMAKTGATHLDLWPAPHGNQREQMESMGHEAFAALLSRHGVKLGVLTHYDLGPFALQDEMRVAAALGGRLLISGGSGPANLRGTELKAAVAVFAEQMKPHIAEAEKQGVLIGIENHANNLIESPDSMRWLIEFTSSPHIGIALAPYHLPQDPAQLATLIRDLGGRLVHFYAWQHGMGCHEKRPKEQELLQMPGRGDLDFVPILEALRKINYGGWTSIFMHPVPRGIPILPTADEVTAEINRAKTYLEACLSKRSGG